MHIKRSHIFHFLDELNSFLPNSKDLSDGYVVGLGFEALERLEFYRRVAGCSEWVAGKLSCIIVLD